MELWRAQAPVAARVRTEGAFVIPTDAAMTAGMLLPTSGCASLCKIFHHCFALPHVPW